MRKLSSCGLVQLTNYSLPEFMNLVVNKSLDFFLAIHSASETTWRQRHDIPRNLGGMRMVSFASRRYMLSFAVPAVTPVPVYAFQAGCQLEE